MYELVYTNACEKIIEGKGTFMKSQKPMPRYKQIALDLQQKIKSEQYTYGNFLPAERILSELYKVERSTLRHALDLLVDDGYIERLRGAGNRVIYRAQEAQDAHEQYSRTVVYVLPDSIGEQGPQPYHAEVCEHLQSLCAQHHYSVILTKARAMGDNVPQWMYSRSVIGAIWVSDVNQQLLEVANGLGIPSLVCTNKTSSFPRINVDDVNAGYLATKHLIQSGCKRIVHITGMQGYTSTKSRLEGYRNAMLEANLPFLRENILLGDWSRQTACDLTTQLLNVDPDIDGIFAANDMTAMGVIEAARKKGIAVPERLKVIGVDNIQEGRKLKTPLSTISFSKEDMAKCLFTSLHAVLHQLPVPAEVILPAKLVPRKSTERAVIAVEHANI